MSIEALIGATLGVSLVSMVVAYRTSRVFAPTAVAAALILYLHGYVLFDFMTDDAFISFRYAHNFADGLGLVWNPDERVEGYTNFTWVLLLAGASKAGLPLPETAQWAGYAAALGTLAVLWALCRLVSRDGSELEQKLLFPATALLLVSNGSFAIWTFAGLETALFTFGVVLAVYLHLREEAESPAFYVSSAALLLVALSRPDGVLLFAVTAAFKGAHVLQHRADRVVLQRNAIWAGAFLVPYVAYLLWRYSYYGYFVPNTFYVKSGDGIFDWPLFQDGLAYLMAFGSRFDVLLLLLAFLGLALEKQQRTTVYLLTVASVWALYVVWVGGDFMPLFRFLAPVVPLVYVLAVRSGVYVFEALQHATQRSLATTGAALLIGVLALTTTVGVSGRYNNDLSQYRSQLESWETTGRFMRDYFPDGTVVALTTAGAIPYYSELPTIDMLGLNDEHIAHHGNTERVPRDPGHAKYDVDYVFERQPNVIIIFHQETLQPLTQASYEAQSNDFVPARRYLLQDKRLFEFYEAESVKIPDGGWFNFLQRR